MRISAYKEIRLTNNTYPAGTEFVVTDRMGAALISMGAAGKVEEKQVEGSTIETTSIDIGDIEKAGGN